MSVVDLRGIARDVPWDAMPAGDELLPAVTCWVAEHHPERVVIGDPLLPSVSTAGARRPVVDRQAAASARGPRPLPRARRLPSTRRDWWIAAIGMAPLVVAIANGFARGWQR